MHFSDERQRREHWVTKALVTSDFLKTGLLRELGIESEPRVAREFDKACYGRSGDVDLVFATDWNTASERLYAIEVKVMILEEDGRRRSEKLKKHNKQLNLLKSEGWHYVYLLDVIVTQPAQSWFHPQAFAGFDAYQKTVEDQSIRHIVLQMNAVAHKPKAEAGSMSFRVIRSATESAHRGRSLDAIRKALIQLWGSCSSR